MTIHWDTEVDDFPACDRRAQLGEVLEALLVDPLPRGDTAAALLGGPKRPKTGSVPFP